MEVSEPIVWVVSSGQLAIIALLIRVSFQAGGAVKTQESHDERLHDLEQKQDSLDRISNQNSVALATIAGRIEGMDRDLTGRIENVDDHVKSIHESIQDMRGYMLKQGSETQIAMASAITSIANVANSLARNGGK